jgi:hypothetical protein
VLFRAIDVVQELDPMAHDRGRTKTLNVDNGPEGFREENKVYLARPFTAPVVGYHFGAHAQLIPKQLGLVCV